MSNKWNNIIREKLESHEVSADHLWNNISPNIPHSSSSFWKPWMTTAAVGTVAVATSAVIYFNSPNSLQPILQTTEQKREEAKIDTASKIIPISEGSTLQSVPEIITGGIPDDILSGYVWQFPEPDSVAASEAENIRNSEIVAIIQESNSAPSENRSEALLHEREPLTQAFSSVVSNAENLRYFFFGAEETADSYVWNFGDGSDGQGQSIAHEFDEEGTYTVKYTVSRGEEVLVEEKTIEVYRPAKLSPATAFVPGIDGLNDVFDVLYNSRNVRKVLDYNIVDANGRVVFQSNGTTVWDGKNSNAELCQPGIYYWHIDFQDSQGVLKSQAGTIRLVAE
jgi:PKD repeat protein